MRRSVMAALAAAVAVGAGLLGAPAAQADPVAAPVAPVADYTPPPIVWGPCTAARFTALSAHYVDSLTAAGAQCGFVVVPLDYAQPQGTKIQLAISRVLHTTATDQGPMLVNPGGPGGSGLIYSTLQGAVPNSVGNMYDWIGFDPRGVGSSKPAVSCIPDYAGFDRPDYEPTKTPGTIPVWLGLSARYAQACKKNGAILDHLTSLESVKDMDQIRKALGAPQINYYGFSYGTYLGQLYATVFPQNLRRAVFDGVVRASGVWYGDNIDQDIAFEKTIKIFFTWVAKYDAVYHLGTTEAAVENLYYATQDQLRKAPAGGKIGPAEWNDIFLQAGYYVYGWVDVARSFAEYVHQGNVQTLIATYKNQTADIDDDNGYAIYLGVQCTDNQWPGLQKQLVDNFRVAAAAPFETWDNGWFNAPCTFWPAKAHRPVPIDGSKAPPILLINETFDAATPYNGALETRQLFPNSALVEGVDGSTHAGSLSGVACTDNTIAYYLATGGLPARVAGNQSDRQCPPVPQPVPPKAGPASALMLASAPSIKGTLD